MPDKSPAEKLAAKKKPTRKRQDGRLFDAHVCLARKMREELGLTIRDVAVAAGISIPCICDVERGAETTLTTAKKLAAFYGRTIDALWPMK